MKKIKVHKRVCAKFYRSRGGTEPVRDWLLGLAKEDRVAIGTDIQTTEYDCPIGMPTCKPMGNGLHEVRTDLSNNRIARVLFLFMTNI
jgi:phage-related protein